MLSLQQALHAVIRDSKHPAKKIALEAGISYGYLMKAADENQPDFNLQAQMVAPITVAAECDLMIEQLAQACGGVFVRLHNSDSTDAHTARTLKEISDYFAKVAQAQADGKITKVEVEEIKGEAQGIFSSVLAQIAKMESEAK